jgi:hypothetical protein
LVEALVGYLHAVVCNPSEPFRKQHVIDRCDLVRTISALLGGAPFG